MTEGPRAHAISYSINKYLSGGYIRNILARSRKVSIDLKCLIGDQIYKSEAYGKNIILFTRNGYAIRVHTLIYGVVKIYKRGEVFDKPERQIRLMVETDNYNIVGFNTPIIEIGEAEKIIKNLENSLGLDPLRTNWNREIVLKKMRTRGDTKIGVVLLDQSIIAGIGNILRNEILYRASINPERIVKNLTDHELNRIIEITEYLFKEFFNKLIREGSFKDLLLVYNKYRGVCIKCGSRIKYYRQEPINRKTFICPICQR